MIDMLYIRALPLKGVWGYRAKVRKRMALLSIIKLTCINIYITLITIVFRGYIAAFPLPFSLFQFKEYFLNKTKQHIMGKTTSYIFHSTLKDTPIVA